MHIPQEIIDRIVLINGYWFARYSTVCSHRALRYRENDVKRKSIRSAIRHLSLIGFDAPELTRKDLNSLVRAYAKKKLFVRQVIDAYRIPFDTLEKCAYEDDAYTFFVDIDVKNTETTKVVIDNCIRHGSFVTFDNMMRRGCMISRESLIQVVNMQYPFPFIQTLCENNTLFDDKLFGVLLKKRQIASLAFIVHHQCFNPNLKKKHAIVRELIQLNQYGNKQIWRQDIDVVESIIGYSMCLFDLQCDDLPLKTLTITDVIHNCRLFSQLCYEMCYLCRQPYSSKIWMVNVFHRLFRIARCRGIFSRECSTIHFAASTIRAPNTEYDYSRPDNPRTDLDDAYGEFITNDMRSPGFLPNDIIYFYNEREMSFSIDEFCTSLKYPELDNEDF